MKYYGKTSSSNTGITKWRRPNKNKDLSGAVETQSDFNTIILSRLKELGPCILPGGKGQPQIIIGPTYTRLKTIKGEWSIMRTGVIDDYQKWAMALVSEWPEKFNQDVVVYDRKFDVSRGGYSFSHTSQGIVYFIGADDMPFVKIGKTQNLEKRMAGIQTSIPFDLKVYFTIPGGCKEEKLSHQAFEQYRKRGEWFRIEGKLKEYMDYMLDLKNIHKNPWEYVNGTGM